VPVLVFSQNSLSDTAFVALAQQNAVKLYTTRIGAVSNVYNGGQYMEYRPQEDEHPYLTPDWIYGDVEYGGEHYKSVSLLYDLSVDELITMHTHGNAIQMIQRKVKSFQLGDRTFVRINNDQIKEGFYERLYDGKVKFYARRQKSLYVKASGNVLRNMFESYDYYYLLKDGRFHSFKSRGSLLRLLSDHKAELKKFARETKMNYRSDREGSAVRILGYYDEITR
jgi:ribosomal protein L21E